MICSMFKNTGDNLGSGARLLLAAGLLVLVWQPFPASAQGMPPRGEDLVLDSSVQKIAPVENGDAARLDAALGETRDTWGEALISAGGATAENILAYLPPLLYSTGKSNTVYGMHHVLYAPDGGTLPCIVAVADGSRLAANTYESGNDLAFHVGPDGNEAYGSALERLEGPVLREGCYPVLQTAYTDASGNRYTQESFAAWPAGLTHLAAYIKVVVSHAASADKPPKLKCIAGESPDNRLAASSPAILSEYTSTFNFPGSEQAVYLAWSPRDPFPQSMTINRRTYEDALASWKQYWDNALSRGIRFDVPETLVMNCQRNLLMQNLMLRWRYSMGAVVYNNSFFQPESSDAMSLLSMYGFQREAREGLGELLEMTKGAGYYTNWEAGEKLSHGAEYFFLTRDTEFIQAHTDAYASLCAMFEKQITADPHGLLEKQRHCGDIPAVEYCTFHQAVGWQGMRLMAAAWNATGNTALAEKYGALAARLRENLRRALEVSEQRLPDESLFIPSMLYSGDRDVYTPITATRLGSYWNLCMPYAFASGLWEFNGADMDGIVRFLHGHGATLLGLLRFNYYPVEIGQCKPDGLPGYWTTGYDNVYLPSYLRVLAQRDDAERLILSFYGKLVHGQTRNTFVSGEGDTVGAFPGVPFRSCYGAVCSANNMAFLLPLRLMLVRESADPETGIPKGLHLAHATPRQWLEPGKRIAFSKAPTAFGPVSLQMDALENGREIRVLIDLPERNPAPEIRLKIRPPLGGKIQQVLVCDESTGRETPGKTGPPLPVDTASGIVTLDGRSGRMELLATLSP